MADDKGSVSGLSEAAAKEFHRNFITSAVIFTAVALVAHILAWSWRPWLPALPTSMIETAQTAVQTMLS
jgi:light-harvesting complex 1 beta chain